MSIRVLIVDDSPTMRALLGELLRRADDIEVVGTAANANEARAAIRQLDPDVVTLDIEMPGMSGLEFLEKLMRLRPTPVVVVSGLTSRGAETTVQALALGAVDCYAKPVGRIGDLLNCDNGQLAELVRAAAAVRSPSRRALATTAERTIPVARRTHARLIAIGSSTGGVEALQVLLGGFPANCPPTVVVQHINGHFAEAVARRLDAQCAPTICLAETDTVLRPGHVYIAPGNDRHLQISGSGGQIVSRLRPGDLVSGHRPSVDALFHSVAQSVGADAVGILLTGMGSDGAHGLLAMRKAGATTIAQDEATCTVFGMPRAAIELGAAERVAAIQDIADHVVGRAA
ncbi:MAG: chemotaxis response regulator protein-glutamate methylesterase [Blastomonas sp.]